MHSEVGGATTKEINNSCVVKNENIASIFAKCCKGRIGCKVSSVSTMNKVAYPSALVATVEGGVVGILRQLHGVCQVGNYSTTLCLFGFFFWLGEIMITQQSEFNLGIHLMWQWTALKLWLC